MNEQDFKEHILHYGLKLRDVIVPTTASYLKYGDTEKTKIIDPTHHEHFYSLLKKIDTGLSDDRLNYLRAANYSDNDIINIIVSEYDTYLKTLRKQIITLQKTWSSNWANERALMLVNKLDYKNIYHICDLTIERNVPYELILKLVFNIDSTYGQFRTPTPKEKIYIDPRIKKTLAGSELIQTA